MRRNYAKSLATLFYLSLLKAAPGLGVDYAFKADASLKEIYFSNFLLQTSSANKGSTFGTDLDVNTHFTAAATNWNARGGARFDNWFYYGPGGDINYQNQYVDGQYSYMTGRSYWNLSGSYINASYVTSVADATQPTGIILGVIQRESRSLSPSWDFSLTEYTKLNLNYQYSDSNYVKTTASQGTYPASTSHTASTGFSHTYNEYLLLNGSLSYSTNQYDPIMSLTARQISPARTMDYLSLTTGFKYSFFKHYNITVNGGGQYTDSIYYTLIPQTSNQISPLFNMSITRQFEHSNLTLNYSHTISPSINGYLFTSDSVSLDASHDFSARLNGDLTMSYYNSTYSQAGTLAQSNTSQQYSYYRLGGNINYKLAQRCVISADYSYILRDLGNASGNNSSTADSNSVSLNLRYDFEPLPY